MGAVQSVVCDGLASLVIRLVGVKSNYVEVGGQDAGTAREVQGRQAESVV